MKLLKQDFDNAVKQDYDALKCLVAQAMNREGVTVGDILHPADLAARNTQANKARMTFDRYFNKPGDENKPKLQALRASLPITI